MISLNSFFTDNDSWAFTCTGGVGWGGQLGSSLQCCATLPPPPQRTQIHTLLFNNTFVLSLFPKDTSI